jgi:hypothetical protein
VLQDVEDPGAGQGGDQQRDRGQREAVVVEPVGGRDGGAEEHARDAA